MLVEICAQTNHRRCGLEHGDSENIKENPKKIKKPHVRCVTKRLCTAAQRVENAVAVDVHDAVTIQQHEVRRKGSEPNQIQNHKNKKMAFYEKIKRRKTCERDQC